MSLLALLQASCLVAFGLLLVMAGWQDLRTMRIANRLSIAIVGAFAVWALAGMAAGTLAVGDLALAAACSVGLFLLGALAFAAGALGGGDVKLLAAASLFASPSFLPEFLMVVALAGGAMAVAILAGAQIGPVAPAGDSPSSARTTVRARLRSGLPYGPAIAAGGLWVAAHLAGA